MKNINSVRPLLLSILLISALMCYAKKKEPMYGNNPAAGHYMQVNGIKMYYETYGKGQPLLMLHGNGGSINAFKEHVITSYSIHYTKLYEWIKCQSGLYCRAFACHHAFCRKSRSPYSGKREKSC